MRRGLALLMLAGIGLVSCRLHPPQAGAATSSGRVQVWIFSDVECPIARGYTPSLRDLAEAFAAQPVDWQLVYVDPTLGPGELEEHQRAFETGMPARVDTGHRLVRLAGVRFTPEAVVWGPGGELFYRGRIDNWYGDLSRKRPRPTRFDLRAAIEAALQGRATARPWPRAVGCDIPPLSHFGGRG